MITALDSSILVVALVQSELHHSACDALLDQPGTYVYSYALVETFSTLSGGRLGYRISAETAAKAIEESILPFVTVAALSPTELISAITQTCQRGVRGAAIFDFLHLTAARKIGASRLYTLNVSDFQSFSRPGDPAVVHP